MHRYVWTEKTTALKRKLKFHSIKIESNLKIKKKMGTYLLAYEFY